MAFPIAHGFLGATVVAALLPRVSLRRDWRVLMLGAVLAITPDLDYFFYLVLGLGEDWRRTFTHSIVFALAAGVLCGALLRTDRLKIALLVLATVSHPLLDALTTDYVGGVELFWPFSPERIRFGVLSYPKLVTYELQTWTEFFMKIVKTSALEFLFFATLFIVVLWLRKAVDVQLGNKKNYRSSARNRRQRTEANERNRS